MMDGVRARSWRLGVGGGKAQPALHGGDLPAIAPAKSRLPGLTCPSSFAKEAFTWA